MADRLEDKIKKNEQKIQSEEPVSLFNKINKPAASATEAPAIAPELDSSLPSLPEQSEVKSVADLDKFSKKVRTGLDSENEEWLTKQADRLKQLNEEAKKVYKEDQSRVDKMRLGAALAQGLAQIGYGLAGLKKGTSGGALEFNKTDWESNYNRILQDYKEALRSGKSEIEADSEIDQSRSKERQRLGEERINRAEQLFGLNKREEAEQDRELERRRQEARKQAEKKGKDPVEAEQDLINKELEKLNKEFREIEKSRAQLEEATSGKERARLLGDIYLKLKQPDDKAKSIKELEELSEDDGRPWYDFFSDKQDLLGEYISKVKSDRISKLKGSEGVAETEAAPEASDEVEIATPDGRILLIPKKNLDKALKMGATVNK